MSARAYLRIAAALWLLSLAAAASAATDIPRLTGRVVDTANVLSAPARARIDAVLTAHESRTTDQVIVLTVPQLQDETVEEFAQRVFDAWKPGIKGRDNGVLLVVVPRDRVLRIHVGYGAEGVLPDALASRIVNEVIVPHLKTGNFDAAIEAGARAIVAPLEQLPPTPAPARKSGPGFFYYLFWGFWLLVLGLLTYYKVTSRKGWIFYVAAAPFWWLVPAAFMSPVIASVVGWIYIVGYPVAKLLIRRTQWYERINKERDEEAKNFVPSSSRGSWSGSDSGSSGSSGGGYSGGGGSSGGGGASGRW